MRALPFLIIFMANTVTFSQNPIVSDEERSSYALIYANAQDKFSKWCDGDPLAYTELFADNLTYFDPGSSALLNRRENLKKLWSPLVGLTKTDIGYCKIADPHFQYFGNVAVFCFNLEYPEESFKATEVYSRSKNGWEISHAHWSVFSAPETYSVSLPILGGTLVLTLTLGIVLGRFTKRKNSYGIGFGNDRNQA